jgi:glycosyltransferase involved in cell wall biosynthesis
VYNKSLTTKEVINCIYVSNTAMYKHQWVVMEAIANLRRKWPINIKFVGGGTSKSRALLNNSIKIYDPLKEYSEVVEFVKPSDMPKLLGECDISIFASSCENLPVTLLESMAVGLPIACSNRGPMVEVLENGGIYFNPEKASEIESAVENIITDNLLRLKIGKTAKEIALSYSWARCGNRTWEFVNKLLEK